MKIRYQTQRLSYRFFISMVIFFALQVLMGILLAVIQMDPTLLQGILNFNTVRALHLNLAVVWIVTGFIGTILFIGPLLGERDIKHAWLAKFLLIAIWVIVGWAFVTLPLAQKGIAGYVGNVPLLQQGKEYLEAGRISDVLLLIGFTIFAYLTLHVFPKKVKSWNEVHWGLAVGVTGLAAVWVFSLISAQNLDMQEYLRWYVVHYWVEAVWEVIHITLIGFLLYKLFGADLDEVGFAVFWGVSLVILSGLIGNSHHYFWIGTPAFWQFWGSLFSALEPLPLIFCIWHVYLDEKHGVKPIVNKAAFYFIFGSAIFEMVGAGVLGFTMTLAYVNIWEHGTWITAAHAHLALFGAFGMLVIGAAYEAIRQVKGIDKFRTYLSKLGFWLLFSGILGMVGSFAYGGTREIYVYRILGLDWWGHQVRPAMAEARALLGLFGFVFMVGAIIVIFDLITLKSREISSREQKALNLKLKSGYKIGIWKKSMSKFEFALWLIGIWISGLLVTSGLFSFSMHSVRLGDPTIPYTLSSVGYVGILLFLSAFAIRFLRAFESRQDMLQLIQLVPDEHLEMIDLRINGNKDKADEEMLAAFNKINHGEAFMLISNEELNEQHLTLYDVIGNGFIWENVEDGPVQWKAKIGKIN
jgi:nitric oxide reductase subunit B